MCARPAEPRSCRVGVLTTSYPRGTGDWAGIFVAELAGWLAERGDSVEVLAPDPARTIHPRVQVRALRYAFTPRLLYGAGAPDNLFSQPVLARLRAWSQLPLFVGRLAAACRSGSRRWERLLSHWLLPCGLVASQAGRGLPHLAIAHSSDVHLLSRLAGGGRLLGATLRPRSGLILTSEGLREPLLALPGLSGEQRGRIEMAEVVSMGTAGPPVGTTPLGADVPPRAGPLALFVGRLIDLKGVDLLIEACDGLPLQLIVIGDGPQRSALERQAFSNSNIRFLGEQSREQVWAWLAAADLLVLPSRVLANGRTDSAPLVVIEALASGVPLVASRVGGVDSLIEHGKQGLLVRPGDVDALRHALSRVALDAPLRRRLAAGARQRGRRHRWDRAGRRLRDLLLAL